MDRIVILDGYTENPGDLSWEGFGKYGSFTVYDEQNRRRRQKGSEMLKLS